MSVLQMMFLPYTPRDGALEEGYEDWLRAVDNPFFNSQPGVLHYTNWVVTDVLAGDMPFTHFDFLVYEGAADALWNNEALGTFAANWVTRWGKDPGNADVSINYHCYNAEGTAQAPSRAGHAAIAYDAKGAAEASERWTLTHGVVGTPPAKSLGVRYLSPGDTNHGFDAAHVALGSLVAGP